MAKSWKVDEIKDRIDQTESDNAYYKKCAKLWADMWAGRFWTDEQQQQARIDHRELVTTRVPYNVVTLAMRLISNDPKISCPNYEQTAEGLAEANARADWLKLLWQRQAKTQKRSAIQSLKWNALVRGRAAVQVSWVNELVKGPQKPFALPILIRPLNPLNVGACYGPMGVEYAYHRYEEKLSSAVRRYPEIKKFKGVDADKARADETICITDFWYVEPDSGEVWNCLLYEDTEFIEKPHKSEYPKIPIICKDNDPSDEPGHEANSILSALYETWKYMNITTSMSITALGRYFWPALYLKSRYQDDLETGEGAVNIIDDMEAQFISPPNNNPNFPLAQAVMDILSNDMQDSTFPRALFGDSGSQRSGYGFALMQSAGVGRISETIDQMQTLIEEVNELCLCFVEKFTRGSEDGVELFGYSEQERGIYGVSLTSEQVGERYDNTVRLDHQVPGDEMQQLIAALQMADRNIISKDTIREDYSLKPVRKDEKIRAMVDMFEADPDLIRQTLQNVHFKWFGEPLPPHEPDFERSPQSAPQQAQTLPNSPLPPQAQGQQTGQTLTGDFQQGADVNQLIATGQIPSPEAYLQQLQGGFSR